MSVTRAWGRRDEGLSRDAAAVITARMCAGEATCDQLIHSLRACGQLQMICEALLDVIEHDQKHLEDIRHFFLRPHETYSIEELANLWRPDAWRTVPLLIHIPRFIAERVAGEYSIPPDLPINVRLEQIILEVFASGEYSVPTRAGHDDPPRTVA